MRELTAGRLREVLSYDPESGEFRWKVRLSARSVIGEIAGTTDERGYIRICIDRNIQRAHRLAWLYMHGAWPAQEIDHLDGDKQNNRIANLRDVARAVNQQNQRSANRQSRSGLRGVKLHKTGKWHARIWANGRSESLGLHDTADLAYAAYLKAKRQHHEGNTL